MSLPSSFYRNHFLWPLLLALALSVLLMGFGGDVWLADRIYALQGHRWAWRDAWLTSAVLHQGGRALSVLLLLAVLVACLRAWTGARRLSPGRHWRWPLLYLVVAGLLGAAVVSVLKSVTNMDCPWGLLRYGGTEEFIGLFQIRPAGMPRGVCFPGGHASAGYAWVSLYFCFLMVRPAWRWHGLAVGLGMGLLFGFTQQLRGAHFISHDLWSLAICWFTSALVFLLMQKPAASSRTSPGVLLHE